MIDTEFDFDIVCLGVSWDKQDCVDDDGHNMVRYFRMDMLMLRASPVMLNEWFANRETMDRDDFETMAEWDHYIDDKEAAQLAWKIKVCEMLGWEPKHVCITNHVSEIFAVSKIERVEAENYGEV